MCTGPEPGICNTHTYTYTHTHTPHTYTYTHHTYTHTHTHTHTPHTYTTHTPHTYTTHIHIHTHTPHTYTYTHHTYTTHTHTHCSTLQNGLCVTKQKREHSLRNTIPVFPTEPILRVLYQTKSFHLIQYT